jgi:hypothetical protein
LSGLLAASASASDTVLHTEYWGTGPEIPSGWIDKEKILPAVYGGWLRSTYPYSAPSWVQYGGTLPTTDYAIQPQFDDTAGGAGPLDGGLNFGGLLAARGAEVGFGAVYIAEPQTVTANLNLQALPGASGPLEVTLRVLDVNKNLVAGPISGLGNLSWSKDLQPGFYVLELRSSDRAPPMSFQMAVTAPQLQAGGSAGARVEKSAGVTGFVAFYLAAKQDVTINLYNENTYGRPRGAGEVILTLMDAQGKVIQQVGPGVMGGARAEAPSMPEGVRRLPKVMPQ